MIRRVVEYLRRYAKREREIFDRGFAALHGAHVDGPTEEERALEELRASARRNGGRQ